MRHRLPSATTVITACLLGLLLGPGKADGQTAHRVKDIADGVYSSGPRGFVAFRGEVYFLRWASDPAVLDVSDANFRIVK